MFSTVGLIRITLDLNPPALDAIVEFVGLLPNVVEIRHQRLSEGFAWDP